MELSIFAVSGLFLPFPLNQTQSDLCLYCSTKFAIGKIIHGFHVAKSDGQFSVLVLVGLSAASFTIFRPLWYLFSPQLSGPHWLGFSPSHCSLLLSSLFCLLLPSLSLKVGGPRAQFLVLFSCLSSLGFTRSTGFNCHLYINGFPIYISSSDFSFTQDKYTQLLT